MNYFNCSCFKCKYFPIIINITLNWNICPRMIYLSSSFECCLILYRHLFEILVTMTHDKVLLDRDTYVIEFIIMHFCKYFYFVFEFTILMC